MIFYINLHADMRKLLIYLIPLLIFAVFCNAAGRVDSSSQGAFESAILVKVATPTDILSANSANMLSAPRTSSVSGSTRVHSTTRRSANANSRLFSGFIKSGKTFNISALSSSYRNSMTVSTSAILRADKLVSLGKLII